MKRKKLNDTIDIYLTALLFLVLSALFFAAMHFHKSEDGALTFYYFFDAYTFASQKLFYVSKVSLMVIACLSLGKSIKLIAQFLKAKE